MGTTSLREREKSMVASQTYWYMSGPSGSQWKTSFCLQGPTEAQVAKYMKWDNGSPPGFDKEGPLTDTSCASKGFQHGHHYQASMANVAGAIKYPHEVSYMK